MRLIARLILLTCLIISVLSQFEDTHMQVQAQLSAGCNTYETTWDTCLTGCSQVEVQQFATAEGAKRLETRWTVCNEANGQIPECASYMTFAVDNPARCDRDNDSYRGTHPGCGTGSDCVDNGPGDDPSINPGATEDCDDTKDNDCSGQADCNGALLTEVLVSACQCENETHSQPMIM